MAVSSPARMHHLFSGPVRPVTVPAASRFPCSGPLRPVTLPTASRCFSTNANDPFYVECDPCPMSKTTSYIDHENPSFLHHEYKVRNLRDGFHIRLYMAGVGKGDVKLWIEGGELIAEGIKEKDFDDEDDTNTVLRYRMLGPPNELFDLDAIKAEIKNGMLRVFVPEETVTCLFLESCVMICDL